MKVKNVFEKSLTCVYISSLGDENVDKILSKGIYFCYHLLQWMIVYSEIIIVMLNK